MAASSWRPISRLSPVSAKRWPGLGPLIVTRDAMPLFYREGQGFASPAASSCQHAAPLPSCQSAAPARPPITFSPTVAPFAAAEVVQAYHLLPLGSAVGPRPRTTGIERGRNR